MLPFGKITLLPTGKIVQNCLSARLGVRPEHLWSRYVPTHHISLLSATSLQAHSEAAHTPSASSSPRPRGGGWESIWASLLSVSCFICFFVLKKRRKNLSWVSCIKTLALKPLQCSHSAPSIPRLNGLCAPSSDMTGTAVTMSPAAIACSEGSGPPATGYGLNTQSQSQPPQPHDRSDLAREPLERVCPLQHTVYVIQDAQNLNFWPFFCTLLQQTI